MLIWRDFFLIPARAEFSLYRPDRTFFCVRRADRGGEVTIRHDQSPSGTIGAGRMRTVSEEITQFAPQAARLLEQLRLISEQYGDALAEENPELAGALCDCATALNAFVADVRPGEDRIDPPTISTSPSRRSPRRRGR